MKNFKKIVSIILIVMVTCIYVNTSFSVQVTEDNFYKTLKSFKKITIKSWNADAPSYEESSMKSSSTRTYDEEVVRNSNKLDYYLTEDGQKVKLFSTDYSIDSNVFKAKTHVEAEDIQHLIKNEEDAWLYLGILMMISQLPGDYVISLAELTGVKTENAYGYYVENVGNESETDPRGIINYKLVNNDEYMDLNLEIDLEKFAKIDSTYLKGEYAYEILIEKRDTSDDKNENQVSDENETKNEVNNVANEINDKNENKNTNTNTNKNTNRNTNTNTNTNTNRDRNVNKNVSNRTNESTKRVDNNTSNKTDNTISETTLPKAGIAKGGLVIIVISMIGIYSYKKYIDYNKMF